jgi:hypothetical protein
VRRPPVHGIRSWYLCLLISRLRCNMFSSSHASVPAREVLRKQRTQAAQRIICSLDRCNSGIPGRVPSERLPMKASSTEAVHALDGENDDIDAGSTHTCPPHAHVSSSNSYRARFLASSLSATSNTPLSLTGCDAGVVVRRIHALRAAIRMVACLTEERHTHVQAPKACTLRCIQEWKCRAMICSGFMSVYTDTGTWAAT